jgi:hypothetical protein
VSHARGQAGAVVDAERRQGEVDHDRVAHGLLEVDVLTDDPGQLVVVRGLVRQGVRVGEQLAQLDGHLVGQVVQAARALARQWHHGGARHVDALGDRFEPHVQRDRRARRHTEDLEADASVAVRRGNVAVERAHGPGPSAELARAEDPGVGRVEVRAHPSRVGPPPGCPPGRTVSR